ncbi:VOC family protein [Streptomyces sp. JJ66]|nr:VOC family protein [Streptomyces sp. JJ66]
MAAHAEGAPCWADAMVPDLAAAQRFYGELFGWTFGTPAGAAPGSYSPAHLGGRQAAALTQKTDGRMPTVWTVYLATPDAEATAERVRAAGGQVISEPRAVGAGPAGVMAVAADPGGAVFGLWEPTVHHGFEVRAEPGAYVWTDLYTRHPREVDAFYPEVFGYQELAQEQLRERNAARPDAAEAGDTGGAEAGDTGGAEAGAAAPEMVVWTPRGAAVDEEHAVLARCLIEADAPAALPAYFLPYFAVRDVDAAVETARRLGGRVTREAETGPYGRWAVLADNQGATFAVLDLSEAKPPSVRPPPPDGR